MTRRRPSLRWMAVLAGAPLAAVVSACLFTHPTGTYTNPVSCGLRHIHVAARMTEGIIAELLGDADRALACYTLLQPPEDIALPVHPLFASALRRQAFSYLHDRAPQQAAELFQQLATWKVVSFDDALARLLLAAARGDNRQTILQHQLARRLQPSSSLPSIVLFNGQALNRQESLAAKTFDQTRQSFPSDPTVWLNWAKAQAWLGHQQQSAAALDTARTLALPPPGLALFSPRPGGRPGRLAPSPSADAEDVWSLMNRIAFAAPPNLMDNPALLFDLQAELQTAWNR